MSLDERFETAAVEVKNISKLPTNEELLELYALFKQATVGDIDTQRPGMLDRKGRAKWDAWNGKKGTSQNAAKEAYVDYVNKIIQKYK
ncbi:acyl-CoA-binding protein homolog [Orussus abietinus]|uniref:acyl-CoA-binding protein homolog n=1 Tax=Orussus abietinus TaxID=222816 RepID=UPI000626201D|nr:acyl-CoA-binding protein homolog [Orussus abietinus]